MTRKPNVRELWTYAQIADLTGKSPATLRVWRSRNKLPSVDYIIGDWPAWKPDTIRKWWDKHPENPTPPADTSVPS